MHYDGINLIEQMLCFTNGLLPIIGWSKCIVMHSKPDDTLGYRIIFGKRRQYNIWVSIKVTFFR
jgi:hypothetical protein